MGKKRKALFLDRDGVINIDSHYPYLPEHIHFRPGIFELCRKAQELDYILIVVTNQAGVAKGKFPEKNVIELHKWMKERFADKGIEIAGFYYCPYHRMAVLEEYRRDSDMRKPKPGMILKAAADHGVVLEESIMLGDKHSDRIELPELESVIIKSEYTGDGEYDVETLEQVEELLSKPRARA